MNHIIQIYNILLQHNLVSTEEDFSQKFCMRHKKWLKDSKYHGFTPTIQVLLNIRSMIQHLLALCMNDRLRDPHMNKMTTDLQRCLSLILFAIENHHSDTLNKLTEMVLHNANNI